LTPADSLLAMRTDVLVDLRDVELSTILPRTPP
jgi:hypothetical protein